MSRVRVSQEIFEWALQRSNLTVRSLIDKFPKLPDWIEGSSEPTLRQLESFARKTKTPLGFFFLDQRPKVEVPIRHFRTMDDGPPLEPSPEMLDTIYMMQQRQAWMREYLKQQGHEPLTIVGSVRVSARPSLVAKRMLKALSLGTNWAEGESNWERALLRLRRTMENAGICVMCNGVVGNNTKRTLDVHEFRGFVLVDEFAPLAFVNTKDSKAAQMFTLAHELAHVLVGSSASFDLRLMEPAADRTEQFCNRSAAEFLVPADKLKRAWSSAKDTGDPFAEVARRFKVSQIVVARRALDVNLINKREFFSFYNEYTKSNPKPTNEDAPIFYPTQTMRLGQRFSAAVIRAAAEGKITYAQAYELTGLRGRTFDNYADRLMGGA